MSQRIDSIQAWIVRQANLMSYEEHLELFFRFSVWDTFVTSESAQWRNSTAHTSSHTEFVLFLSPWMDPA